MSVVEVARPCALRVAIARSCLVLTSQVRSGIRCVAKSPTVAPLPLCSNDWRVICSALLLPDLEHISAKWKQLATQKTQWLRDMKC